LTVGLRFVSAKVAFCLAKLRSHGQVVEAVAPGGGFGFTVVRIGLVVQGKAKKDEEIRQ
jgi:hypothetical protein